MTETGKTRVATVVLLLAALMLPGCREALMAVNSAVSTAASTLEMVAFGDGASLKQTGNAAADYLNQQARGFIGGDDLIKAAELKDLDHPEMAADIGLAIPEKVGERLAYLGYRVDLRDVSRRPDAPAAASTMTIGEEADFFLTGTYRQNRSKLEVSLRIRDAWSERIVAAFDYSMPVSREVRELSKPRARIFKVQ